MALSLQDDGLSAAIETVRLRGVAGLQAAQGAGGTQYFGKGPGGSGCWQCGEPGHKRADCPQAGAIPVSEHAPRWEDRLEPQAPSAAHSAQQGALGLAARDLRKTDAHSTQQAAPYTGKRHSSTARAEAQLRRAAAEGAPEGAAAEDATEDPGDAARKGGVRQWDDLEARPAKL